MVLITFDLQYMKCCLWNVTSDWWRVTVDYSLVTFDLYHGTADFWLVTFVLWLVTLNMCLIKSEMWLWLLTGDLLHLTLYLWGIVTCDKWLVTNDIIHLTCDFGIVNCDLWLVTHDMWHGLWIFWPRHGTLCASNCKKAGESWQNYYWCRWKGGLPKKLALVTFGNFYHR